MTSKASLLNVKNLLEYHGINFCKRSLNDNNVMKKGVFSLNYFHIQKSQLTQSMGRLEFIFLGMTFLEGRGFFGILG